MAVWCWFPRHGLPSFFLSRGQVLPQGPDDTQHLGLQYDSDGDNLDHVSGFCDFPPLRCLASILPTLHSELCRYQRRPLWLCLPWCWSTATGEERWLLHELWARLHHKGNPLLRLSHLSLQCLWRKLQVCAFWSLWSLSKYDAGHFFSFLRGSYQVGTIRSFCIPVLCVSANQIELKMFALNSVL